MDTPTKVVYRSTRDYTEFYAYNAATGQLLTAAESLDPACTFTQIIYIYTYTDGEIVESVKLYRLGQSKTETP